MIKRISWIYLGSLLSSQCKPPEEGAEADVMWSEGTSDSTETKTFLIESKAEQYLKLTLGNDNSRVCFFGKGSQLESLVLNDMGDEWQLQDIKNVTRAWQHSQEAVLEPCKDFQLKPSVSYYLKKANVEVINKQAVENQVSQKTPPPQIAIPDPNPNPDPNANPYPNPNPNPNPGVPEYNPAPAQPYPQPERPEFVATEPPYKPSEPVAEKPPPSAPNPPNPQAPSTPSQGAVCGLYAPMRKGTYTFIKGGMFGAPRKYPGGHNGQDYTAKTGTPMYATAQAAILPGHWDGAYGKLIRLLHPACRANLRYLSFYAHLSHVDVAGSQWVKPKQFIGKVGNTGSASRGSHLHFEVRNYAAGSVRLNPVGNTTKGSP